MKYETIRDVRVPKIGFGSARLGGRLIANRNSDEFFLSALRSALELGFRHFDTAEFYAGGHAEELIGRAVHDSAVRRDTIFVTTKVWPTHLSYASALHACENSLRRLQLEYLDLYLIHWPNPLVPLKETFRALNQLVRQGKIRHIGVSNFNTKLIQRAQTLAETPLLADQVPYSLTRRHYAANGTLDYCQQNDMLVTGYTPVDHGHLAVRQSLQSIADAHGATPYQIALAWLVNQPRVITIPLSFDPKHQQENLAAADIELTAAEMEQLNRAA